MTVEEKQTSKEEQKVDLGGTVEGKYDSRVSGPTVEVCMAIGKFQTGSNMH